MGIFEIIETIVWINDRAKELKDRVSTAKEIAESDDGIFEKISALSDLSDDLVNQMDKKLSEPTNGRVQRIGRKRNQKIKSK